MDKFIILRTLLTRRQTAAGWGHRRRYEFCRAPAGALSRFEREKISFQIACAPRISINKQNARWKGGKSSGAASAKRERGEVGEGGREEEEEARDCGAMLRQTIEYA